MGNQKLIIGIICGVSGLQFAVPMAGLILLQLVMGELPVGGDAGGALVGLECAFLFFSVGLTLCFVGMWVGTRSAKVAAVSRNLAAGAGIGSVAAPVGLAISIKTGIPHLFWLEVAVWAVATLVFVRRAKRTPDYMHADTLAEVSGEAPKCQTFRPVEGTSKLQVGTSDRRRPHKICIVVAALFALFPAVLISVVMYEDGFFEGVFGLVAVGFVLTVSSMFGAFGYAATWLVTTGPAFTRSKFTAFAERVNGRVETKRFLGIPVMDVVEFVDNGRRARFEEDRRDSDCLIQTRMKFWLPGRMPDFSVHPRSGWIRLKREPALDLGWEPFDDLVVVSPVESDTHTEAAMRRIVTRSLQESLLKLIHWTRKELRSKHYSLMVSTYQGETTLAISVNGLLRDADRVMQFHALCGTISEQLSEEDQDAKPARGRDQQ